VKQIGRRIYYEKTTGNVILDTGERAGNVVETSIDDDFVSYYALSERVRETIGVLELEYEQHKQDFSECSGYRVNIETKELEFSYPDPSEPEKQPVFGKPLTEQIANLELQNTELMLAVAELAGVSETDKMETQLAIAELASIITGGVA